MRSYETSFNSGDYFYDLDLNSIVANINTLIKNNLINEEVNEITISSSNDCLESFHKAINSYRTSSINIGEIYKIFVKNTSSQDIYIQLCQNTYWMPLGDRLIYIPSNGLSSNEYRAVVYLYKVKLSTLYIYCKNMYSPFNYVDLGLPSGTLWADRNLGESTTHPGLFYQFGGYHSGVYPTNTYGAYKYFASPWWLVRSWPTGTNYTDGSITLRNLNPNDDPCYYITNGNACIPSKEQWAELNIYTTKSVSGTTVTLTSTVNKQTLKFNISTLSYYSWNNTTPSSSEWISDNYNYFWCSDIATYATSNNCWYRNPVEEDNTTYRKSYGFTYKMDASTGSITLSGPIKASRMDIGNGCLIRPVAFNNNTMAIVCIVEDTLITLSNNVIKKIQDVTYDDLLFTYDIVNDWMKTEKPLWIMKPYEVDNYVLLKFDDNTTLKVSRGSDGHCHRLYSIDDKQYIQADLLQDKDVLTFTGKKRVIEIVYIQEKTTIYNIIVNKYFSFFADNVLTGSGFANSLSSSNNRTYDEFEPYGITEEMYEGLDLQHTDNSVEDVIKYIDKLNKLKQ